MGSIKTLPPQERPRERLYRFGSDALSSIELLAILLGSGTRSKSVLELAQDLLSHFSSLQSLMEASVQELQEVKGIGLAKAIQLHAAFALSERVKSIEFPILDTSEKIYFFVREELTKQKVEVLMVLLLDVRKRCIHREILSKGTLTELLLHPREIFHVAIKHRAHSIVLVHNHPSGDPTPSCRDKDFTEKLILSSKLIGISIVDHLIIGNRIFFSFADSCRYSSESKGYQ